MTAVGYISDMQEIITASWSLSQNDGAAAFQLSERSPLPPAVSAKNLPRGQTQISNACQIRGINRHPVKSDEDGEPESISDTEDWLNWNEELDNSNDSEDNCVAYVESDMDKDISIEDLEYPEQRDVRATPNVPQLIRPTCKPKRQPE